MNRNDSIYQYWERMAQQHGTECRATIPDHYLKILELESIYKHLSDNVKILDAGCGNGYSALQIKKRFRCEITAVDFSETMIKTAKSEQALLGIDDGLRFDLQDILSLGEPDEYYDIAITERSIINLESWEKQRLAIREIWRVLRPNGLYIMAEAFEEPLANLNKVRESLGLSPIQTKWHNIYLSEVRVREYVQDMFDILTVDNYSSTYYLLTRAVSPKIGEIEGRATTYTDPINQVAAQLPKTGDFGPQKIIVFKKTSDSDSSTALFGKGIKAQYPYGMQL